MMGWTRGVLARGLSTALRDDVFDCDKGSGPPAVRRSNVRPPGKIR